MSQRAQPSWSGMADGPWPFVTVRGDLERADREWLVTSDVGAYAMSTIALMHTRRQHGLFVTPIDGRSGRYVVLSHLEMVVETAGKTYQLSTHQFPNTAPTPGYRHLEVFAIDPLPRWVYRFPSGSLERTLCLVDGQSAAVMSFSWQGKYPARVTLRPLMPMRSSEQLCHEHGGMLQRVVLRSREVEVQPLLELPPVVFRHSGVFMGSPDWWRKFEYLSDRGRYLDFQEDMWSPGAFEFDFEPRDTRYLQVSVGATLTGDPVDYVLRRAETRLATDLPQRFASDVRSLAVAASMFVSEGGRTLVAGYPWLGAWSRDTLHAIPGVFLVRGDVEGAKRTYLAVLDELEGGLLPQRLGPCAKPASDRAFAADATLLLFDIGAKILEADGDSVFRARVTRGLHEVLTSLFSRGAPPLFVSEVGFVENRASYPLTWMDSASAQTMFSPRFGVAIELQALYHRALELAEALFSGVDDELAVDAARRRRALRTAFGQRFWCHDSGYPFDCISGSLDETTWTDRSLRPNALQAVAVAPDLFEPWQRQEIVLRVEERLLTERGVRTLDPADPRYVAYAGGTIEERAAASHQGAAWPHLLLYYVRAALREGRDQAPLEALVRGCLQGGALLGHVAQMADGDPPQRGRGAPAYAMATAMVLEALAVDLGVGEEGRALW